jgi:hypothetical protein
MKITFKILAIFSVVLSVGFTGCLKDKDFDEGRYNINLENAPEVVQLLGFAPGDILSVINLEYASTDTTFNGVVASLAADQPAVEDITVTLVQNPTLVTDYNTAHGTTYTLLPTAIYSIPSTLTIKIPKGSREGYVTLKAKPSDIAAGNYALGFSISSISSTNYRISGNFKNVVVALGVKNRYDGVYNLRFKMLDWNTAYTISNQITDWPAATIEMRTTSANTVNMFSALHGDYIHVAATSAGGLTGFGSTNPRFVFDLNTNKLIGVSNAFPNPSNGRTFELNTAVTTSRWEPKAGGGGDIYAAIILKQPGRPDLMIYDTLKFVRAR